MPITRSGKMAEGKRMSEDELLALQIQLAEKEKFLQSESHKLEASKKQAENTIHAEWEKVKQHRQSFDVGKLFEGMEKMQSEILKLNTLCARQNTQNEIPRQERSENRIVTSNNNRDTQIGLKDVLGTIPYFNGQDISVFHFSRTCERARDMLPRNLEFSLVQMIINKLKGHAFQLIQDLDLQTIDELTMQLKDTFAPRKTMNQYRGELGNIHQNPNESVLEYAGRLKNIKAGLLDCERQTRGEITISIKNEIEQDSIDSFVNGLMSQTRINLKIEGYTNLNDAISKAVRISTTLTEERKRFGNRLENSRNNLNQRNNNYEPVRNERNQPRRDRELNPNAVPYTPRNNALVQNNNNFVRKVCSYCNTPGHERSQCRKLAYRNAQPGTSGTNNTNTRPVNFLEEDPIKPDPPPESRTSN